MKLKFIIGVLVFTFLGCSGNAGQTLPSDENMEMMSMEEEQQEQSGEAGEDEQVEPIELRAKYEITFTSLWNRRDHLAVPGNAHFSPIVLTVHNNNHALLPIGELTGEGLEDVAEVGQTGKINAEISLAKEDGSVLSSLNTENQFVPETPVQTIEIEVTQDFSLVSFVTMIAPSPDWVVGVDSLNLSNGRTFVEETEEINLYALNAGTEDGDRGGNFSIRNSATRNPTPIERLRGRGFDAPFAKVKFKKIK